MKLFLESWIATSVLLLTAYQSIGQSSPLVIVKLEPPNYPPIAAAARVSGLVELQVTLLPDGTIGDLQIKSGLPMLRNAAVQSAKSSLFQPAQSEHSDSYQLIYKFVLDAPDCGEAFDPSYPHVSQSSNVITILGRAVPICDTAPDIRVRSAKCLYLWRCAWKAS